jgi:hypothetical protein
VPSIMQMAVRKTSEFLYLWILISYFLQYLL